MHINFNLDACTKWEAVIGKDILQDIYVYYLYDFYYLSPLSYFSSLDGIIFHVPVGVVMINK